MQAQEARILQLEAQNRSDADNRERERQTLISDFRVASASSRTQDLSSAASASSSTLKEQDRNEIAGLRSQIGAEAVASASSRPPGLESRLVDTRVIGKPDWFFGEREKWKGWSMVLKAYMMAVNPEYVGAFERLDKAAITLHNDSLSTRSSKLSVQLYYVLVMLSRAKAQDEMYTCSGNNIVGQGEVFSAWQRLLADYDQKIRTRRVEMLIQILTATFTGDLAQALDQSDTLSKEYEQCCNDETECPACHHKWRRTFDGQLRAGLVVASMGDSDIQQHLLKNFNRLDTFEKIREEVLELTRASQYLQSQARPMELGAFHEGKGEGDGNKTDKKCNYCGSNGHAGSNGHGGSNGGKAGHLWAECRTRIADEGKAPAGPKGKGKKGKAAGAGPRAPAKDVCNYCGKTGHKEAQCSKKKRDKQPGGLAATAQVAPETEPVPIKALQLSEGELHERVPMGFLLPLAQAEAKVAPSPLAAMSQASTVRKALAWTPPVP